MESALEVLIDAYIAMGKDDLAADTKRVLDLNRQAGRFISDEPTPGEVSLARRLWDYLSLDEN